MKKFRLFILRLFTVFFTCNFTQAKDYEYTNLDIVANILSDWTTNVNEDFTANFFVNKHWIIRDIPLNYSVEWKDFHIEVSNIDVQWKNFTTSKNNWNIEIKIWDANRTLIWEQDYPISYSTYWLIRNFSWIWYAELYWNLVGYKFATNINKIRAELILPKIYTWFTKDDFLITTDGTTKTIDWFGWTVDWSRWNKIIITYDKWLSAFQGITLAIKFPNNYFEFDHNRQAELVGKVWINFFDNLLNSSWFPYIWFFALLFGSFFVFALIQKLFKKLVSSLKDKTWSLKWYFTEQSPVVVQYEPPKWINSAEAWLLLHNKAQVKDLLSLIYKRASEWLITISLEKTEGSIFSKSKDIVILSKIRNITENAPDYEKNFFKFLIRWEKNKIEKSMSLYDSLGLYALENYGEKEWRFKSDKNKWVFVLWLVLIFFFLNSILQAYSFLWVLLFWGCVFWMRFLWILGKQKTEKWAKLISHILWYKEFLSACDENKLRLFLDQDSLYFDKILPYAVAFWLETELLKKIEPIMKEMNIRSTRYNWDFSAMYLIDDIISSAAEHSVSYSSSGWFSGWSSFWWGFSSWWWGWGGWWRSW